SPSDNTSGVCTKAALRASTTLPRSAASRGNSVAICSNRSCVLLPAGISRDISAAPAISLSCPKNSIFTDIRSLIHDLPHVQQKSVPEVTFHLTGLCLFHAESESR